MSDQAFRLTPHDIRNQSFTRVMRGFDRLSVQEFQSRVAEEFELLLRDRVQQEERLRSAQDQLRAYRERERALNEALVAAQQLRNDSREQAEREADALVREARAEAARIVERALQEEQLVHARFEGAQRQFAAYLMSLRALLDRQTAEVEALQAHAPPVAPFRPAVQEESR